ncbi:hypothetical protein [Haloarcula laminariae]|uniref:hypothetical protein n=1 Tax=Haloarcula laminariae TaxID=2961577 RepID=UPI0021C57FE9|nr:hypothetical protein [Halomicroarcula laminariae]
MVRIEKTAFLSDIRGQSKYREFPDSDYRSIEAAVEEVPADVFHEHQKGIELREFDSKIASELPGYDHEHDDSSGRNSACKLWADAGFDHSVDLYNADERIAIEIEKSEAKRVSDDILKFIRGGKTQREKRQTIEFGCLIVPTNYGGSRDLHRATTRNLEFIRSVLFVEDIAVLGYEDPRWG